MKIVLIVTVGGSCAPVVSAVTAYKLEHIFFVCSNDSAKQVNGQGNPCGVHPNKIESIVVQTKLKEEQYTIKKVEEPDDPVDVYRRVSELIHEVREKFQGHHLYICYTGGTKSMSAGAMMAAFDDGDSVLVNIRGVRKDLTTVSDGTEEPELIPVRTLYVRRQLRIARDAFSRFDYPTAAQVLQDAAARPVDKDLNERIRNYKRLAKGLGAWDILDYEGACNILVKLDWVTDEHREFLNRSHKSIKILKNIESKTEQPLTITEQDVKDLTMHPVYDLLLNARRRGEQRRYDDALGRLYRALELYAQIRLLQRDEPIWSANVAPESLPQAYKPASDAHQGRKLGLVDAFELLQALGDEVGKVYSEWAQRIRQCLTMRNHSLLAHGFTPVTADDYQKALETVEEFIKAANKAKGERNLYNPALQFPTPLD